MKSSNENSRTRLASAVLALGLAAALSGCGMFDGDEFADELPMADSGTQLATMRTTGPAADYPMVVGDPFTVNGVLFTPSDAMNYDEVGHSVLDGAGGSAVTAASRTLPLPSYAEVTSLDTGRTILVRVERRGPMSGDGLIALSPGAADQLGAGAGTPVRVRRVNPPEPERAALRLGGRAADRIETPESLLAVLRRKLPGARPAAVAESGNPEVLPPAVAPVPVATPAARPSSTASLALPPLPPLAGASGGTGYTPRPAPAQAAAPRPAPVRAAPQPSYDGAYIVQAGAYSTRDRAQRVANVIGGSVSNSGGLYRVRTGPFGSRAQAEASLAKVRAAGYSEARIFTNG